MLYVYFMWNRTTKQEGREGGKKEGRVYLLAVWTNERYVVLFISQILHKSEQLLLIKN